METDNYLAGYQASIEQRLREQIARHRSIAPTATTQRIKDIQLSQEIERIENSDRNPDVKADLIVWVKDLIKRL